MMARIQYTPKSPGRPHPVAVAHALISPMLRQHQALLGYSRVLHALPKVSIYSPTLELLKTHINNSMIYSSQAINHAVVVLEHMLARKSEGILLPPEPYPILSTLTLLQRELATNLERLSMPTAFGHPNLDPFTPQALIVDWSDFAQSRFRVTPTEGKVIEQLIDGHTVIQIAKAFSRSSETIRTQTKNAREKVAANTGVPVHNITRLVSVVLLTRLQELAAGGL